MHQLNGIIIKYSSRNIQKALVPVRNCVKFSFIEAKDNRRVDVQAKIGKSVLDVALDNNIDIEGACGGELACSTCHVVLTKDVYDKLPPKSEEEEDMLDLAWGLTET